MSDFVLLFIFFFLLLFSGFCYFRLMFFKTKESSVKREKTSIPRYRIITYNGIYCLQIYELVTAIGAPLYSWTTIRTYYSEEDAKAGLQNKINQDNYQVIVKV